MKQGTNEWFMARLGHITSSEIYNIIKTKQNGGFTDSGKSYLYGVAAERNLFEAYRTDPQKFEQYFDRTHVKDSRTIRWGREKEAVARAKYQKDHPEVQVVETGFVIYKTQSASNKTLFSETTDALYGDSPDGLIIDKKTGEQVGAIEIKCPTPPIWLKYKNTIHTPNDLKELVPEYYWQCMSHILVNNVQYCEFIFFDPMQKNGYQCLRIPRDEQDILTIATRLFEAEQYIKTLLD